MSLEYVSDLNNNKAVVEGYVKQIQAKMTAIIPLAIINLCTMFYYLSEYFTGKSCGKSITITNEEVMGLVQRYFMIISNSPNLLLYMEEYL